MKPRLIAPSVFIIVASLYLFTQAAPVHAGDAVCRMAWSSVFGYDGTDSAKAVTPCRDGGVAMAGSSRMWELAEADYLIYRLDKDGVVQWSCIRGALDGQSNAMAYGITETRDGDFIVVGEKRIYTILDSLGMTPSYRQNFWVLKIDAQGNRIWDNLYGGEDYDRPNAVVECSDGGYVIAGHTQSFGAEYTPQPLARKDLWVLKIDKDGNEVWNKLYGKPDTGDGATSIRQCRDGGFIVCGFTNSYGARNYDAWVLKLNAQGDLEWMRTAGGPKFDQAGCVIESSTGRFLVAGETSSFGAGNYDFYVLCYDRSGTLLWSRTYGGPSFERARAIVETPDNDFIVAGYTSSYGQGDKDVWLVKIDPDGNRIWSQTFGGPSCDEAYAMTALSGGGFAVAGNTASWGTGGVDGWVFKLQDLTEGN